MNISEALELIHKEQPRCLCQYLNIELTLGKRFTEKSYFYRKDSLFTYRLDFDSGCDSEIIIEIIILT